MEHYSPHFTIAGLVFDIPNMLMMLFASLVVFFLIVACTRNLTSGVPKGMQNFLEWVIDFVRGIAGTFMPTEQAAKYVTLGLTLFLYIFISNQLGVVFNFVTVHETASQGLGITPEMVEHAKKAGQHGVEIGWFKSPTASPSITFALALMVLIYSHFLGIKKDPGSYVKHYFKPYPALFIIHFMEEFLIKVLTLPLRLFGNIFAGEVLIGFLLSGTFAVTAIPLAIWLGYSLFVGAVQAYIFTTLTLVYISQKVVDDH
jgi:F-type H+-transporting ATPase subunit a